MSLTVLVVMPSVFACAATNPALNPDRRLLSDEEARATAPREDATYSAEGTSPVETVLRWFPLAVGNQWVYQVDREGQAVLWKRKILNKDAEGFFVMSDGSRIAASPFGVRDSGRYVLRIDNGQPMTTWYVQIDPLRREQFRLVSRNVTVVVPAGEFKGCIVVQGSRQMPDGNRLVEQSVYAPDVGMVQRKLATVTSKGAKTIHETAELQSYQFAASAAKEQSP